jgi:AbiU2
MHIKISSAEEFESLLNALCDETVNACIHYRLYTDLEAARPEYATAFQQSWTFWSLTLQSHWDTTLFRLCKIYDQHSTSLNLKNLLDTVEENVGIFDVDNFRERLKGNAFVDSLASGAKRPDIPILKKDRDTVCDTEPRVKALVFWRNNFFAHRSARLVAGKKNLADHYTFEASDVDALLKNAMRILNSYSVLFRASSYSTQIVGHDDYRYVLQTITDAVKRHDDDVERELAKFQERNP